VHTKDSGTNHILVNLWLALYKLTGWLASLNTTVTTSIASSATKRRPPMPCMTYWFWDKTMDGLVDRDRELPANTVNPHSRVNKTKQYRPTFGDENH